MTADDLAHFIERGFVRLDGAFSRILADECRALLWKDTGCDARDPKTWTRPVIRLGFYPQAPFREAANTPQLVQAYDRLVGKGRWRAPQGLGTFPVRFPSAADPGDCGWHVDVSYPGPDAKPDDYFAWRANVHSRGRALLMLFLFSDVGEDDAPTRIRAGSHRAVARLLQPFGEEGLPFIELAARAEQATAGFEEALATGAAGTVYLCHPFIVHAAQPHRGIKPRFMAQPPLFPA